EYSTPNRWPSIIRSRLPPPRRWRRGKRLSRTKWRTLRASKIRFRFHGKSRPISPRSSSLHRQRLSVARRSSRPHTTLAVLNSRQPSTTTNPSCRGTNYVDDSRHSKLHRRDKAVLGPRRGQVRQGRSARGWAVPGWSGGLLLG